MNLRVGCRVAVLGLAAALLAGCTGTNPTTPTTTSTPTEPAVLLPHANDYSTAITNTYARGSALLDIVIDTTVDGTARTITGHGSAAFRDPLATMTWTGDGVESIEIADDDGRFVQAEAPDGPWLKVRAWTPTMGAEHPLTGLGDVADVQVTGTEEIAGTATTRFTGTVPLNENLTGLGLDEAAQALVAADSDAHLVVTSWVGPDGLIKRVQRDLVTSAPVRASVRADLTRLAVDVPAKAPPDYQTAR